MISYLPPSYPDELLFSHLVRNIRNTLSTNYVETSTQLFGIPNAELSIDLQTRVQFLFNAAYHLIEPSPISVINKYTMLQWYHPFLTNTKREYAIQVMINGPGTGLHAKLGINAGSSNAAPFPKICPLCFVENRREYGEAYFHRIHQIPDILICPYHEVFVQEYRPIFEYNGYAKILDPVRIQIEKVKIIENSDSTLLSLSQTFSKIFNGIQLFDVNTTNYYDSLIRSKYSRGSQLKWEEIVSDFEKFYGRKFLESILKQPISTWIKGIVHKPQSYFHPLRHILVTQFLETLTFKTDLFENSFQDGPWVCLNKGANHYNKRVVHDINIEYSSRAKTRVAVARCSCGMVYNVKFKLVKGELNEFKKIAEYGNLWVKAVKKEIQKGRSIRSVARKFGVSIEVIQRWALNPNKVDMRKHADDFQKVRDEKRKAWLSLLKNESPSKITFAKAQDQRLYYWLYHNDPDWIKAINTKHRKPSLGNRRKNDWNLIDTEISNQLSLFAEKIKHDKYEGMISKNFLSKEITRIKYFSFHDKVRLPKTDRILTSILENSSDYQARKASKAIKEMTELGELITLNKVMRRAGIKSGNNSTNETISKLISKHLT